MATNDDHVPIRRNHVHVIGLEQRLVDHLLHRHRRRTREDLGQRAFVRGREVLHQDESHARIRGKRAQQSIEGLQASRGSSDAHDRESEGLFRVDDFRANWRGCRRTSLFGAALCANRWARDLLAVLCSHSDFEIASLRARPVSFSVEPRKAAYLRGTALAVISRIFRPHASSACQNARCLQICCRAEAPNANLSGQRAQYI